MSRSPYNQQAQKQQTSHHDPLQINMHSFPKNIFNHDSISSRNMHEIKMNEDANNDDIDETENDYSNSNIVESIGGDSNDEYNSDNCTDDEEYSDGNEDEDIKEDKKKKISNTKSCPVGFYKDTWQPVSLSGLTVCVTILSFNKCKKCT